MPSVSPAVFFYIAGRRVDILYSLVVFNTYLHYVYGRVDG